VTRYLLDTNIISDLARHPRGRVAERIAEVGDENVCTSIIVAAEVRFGLLKTPSPKLTTHVEAVIGALDVLPFAPPADHAYVRLRRDLEARGRPIGANELLIAPHAIAAECTLVTRNMREFARIDQLALENWLDPD
jgi:tRNA(fMet)-specific endonuclease VapC